MKPIRQKLYHLYTEHELKEHHLRYLFFEITRRCNLKCIHCGSDCTSNSTMNELTTESWLKIIDYIKDTFFPLPFIVLTGGEPTIHQDLHIITEALHLNGFSWGMVTNGYNLNKESLSLLMKNGIKSITVSFDGDRESTSYIRNSPRVYDKVLNAIDLIGRSSIKFKDAVTCVYPGNLDKLNWISNYLVEHGMNSHRLFRIFPKGRAAENKDLILDFNESNRIVSWIAEHRKSFKKKGLNLSFSCEGYLPYSVDLKVRSEPYFCRSGISIASILCDGTITGCNNNGPDYYQGNIITDNFAYVWSDKFKEYRDKGWLKTGACENCLEWKYCKGSSIHLRDKYSTGPDFCYVKDIQN